MKLTKRLFAAALALMLVLALAACGINNTNNTTTTAPAVTPTAVDYKGDTIKVAAIKGPTGMGMVNMMDNDIYDFTLTSDPTEVATLLATGKVDIAACPLNLAANLYKKTNGGVQMLAINTLGVLYLLTNGETVNSLSDLNGKTIYATGQGATPEYIRSDLLNTDHVILHEDPYSYEEGQDTKAAAASESASDVINIITVPEPTPQIIYVTVNPPAQPTPTPILVYVTPDPAALPTPQVVYVNTDKPDNNG